MAVQPDGKLLIGGTFSIINGVIYQGLARLNADGSLDESFDPGAGLASGGDLMLTAIVIQRDGDVLIGGEFSDVDRVPRAGVARIRGGPGAGLPSLTLAQAVDATNLVWSTSGDYPWFGETNITSDGQAAAQSAAIGNEQVSWIETTVTGPGVVLQMGRRLPPPHGRWRIQTLHLRRG